MREVGVLEAKNTLPRLLHEVERGGAVLITRRGRPVARLGPAAEGFDRSAAPPQPRACVGQARA